MKIIITTTDLRQINLLGDNGKNLTIGKALNKINKGEQVRLELQILNKEIELEKITITSPTIIDNVLDQIIRKYYQFDIEDTAEKCSINVNVRTEGENKVIIYELLMNYLFQELELQHKGKLPLSKLICTKLNKFGER